MKVLTTDSFVVELSPSLIQQSLVLKDLNGLSGDTPIPLTDISKSVLDTLAQACEGGDFGDVIHCLVDTDMPHLVQVLEALNFLNMETILETACDVIADRVQGKTEREIREFFECRL
jgi:hypothetical protein